MNGDKLDNRIANLREATGSLNQQNVADARRSSSTGLLGVAPHGEMWAAYIRIPGERRRYLGRYATPEEAHAVYAAAKREHHSCVR